MTQQRGSKTKLILGWEDSYAVAPSAGFIVPINSFSPSFSQNVNAPATIRGDRNPAEPFRGNWQSTFSLVVPVDSITIWYWLMAMFDTPVTTGTGPYVHTFKIGDRQPSFTLEDRFTDLASAAYFQYLGCKISSMALTLGGDGELLLNLNGNGSYLNIATSSFAASPTAPSFARLGNFQASVNEGGASLSNATEVSLNIDFDHDPVRVIGGQGKIGAINEGIPKITGALTTLFEDQTLYNKALNGTESSITSTLTGSNGDILEFQMQELQYGINSPNVEGPRGILTNLNYSAYYTDGADQSAIVATLTNGDAHA